MANQWACLLLGENALLREQTLGYDSARLMTKAKVDIDTGVPGLFSFYFGFAPPRDLNHAPNFSVTEAQEVESSV